MAAVLACGPGAVLSHRSAATLLDLRRDGRAAVELTSPRQAGRRRSGIHLHRSRTLAPEDITEVNGIPCTTVARTLVDLAEVLDDRGIARIAERAERLFLLDLRAVQGALRRAGPRRRAGRLESLLTDAWRAPPTRSELERRFLELLRAARLPDPEANAWIPFPDGGGAEADFLWRDRRLVIETDGRETHATRTAFERDRLRDQRLAVAGYRVIRFTWRQVVKQPQAVTATMASLLRAPARR